MQCFVNLNPNNGEEELEEREAWNVICSDAKASPGHAVRWQGMKENVENNTISELVSACCMQTLFHTKNDREENPTCTELMWLMTEICIWQASPCCFARD